MSTTPATTTAVTTAVPASTGGVGLPCASVAADRIAWKRCRARALTSSLAVSASTVSASSSRCCSMSAWICWSGLVAAHRALPPLRTSTSRCTPSIACCGAAGVACCTCFLPTSAVTPATAKRTTVTMSAASHGRHDERQREDHSREQCRHAVQRDQPGAPEHAGTRGPRAWPCPSSPPGRAAARCGPARWSAP